MDRNSHVRKTLRGRATVFQGCVSEWNTSIFRDKYDQNKSVSLPKKKSRFVALLPLWAKSVITPPEPSL